MTQEELKTCLGRLLFDLKLNWINNFHGRLMLAKELCSQINDDTSDVEYTIEMNLAHNYGGHLFKECALFGYVSKEGITNNTKEWLKLNLSMPKYCNILNID